MKKIWIAVAGIAAVLTVALVVVMLTSPVEHIDSSDEESRYPYGYELTEKGLEVHISGSFPKEFRWVALSESGEIHVAEKKQSGKKAVFLLTAESSGHTTVRFLLQKENEGLTEQTYEITISVVASATGKLSVMSNSHREISGLAAGSGEGFTYQAADQMDGSVVIQLSAEENMEWTIETEGTSVDVTFEAVTPDALTRTVRMEYAKLGQTWVRLCAGETGQAVELYVTTDAQNHVSLVSHAVISYTPVEDGALEAHAAEFKNIYGTVALPQECLGVERVVDTWENGEQVGYLGFLLSGCRWEMYLFKDGGNHEPTNWSDAPETAVDTTLGGNVALLGTWGKGSSALWCMENDTYLLRCDEADAETLRTVAEQVITAVQHG